MTEKQLQASIVHAARALGWRDASTWRSLHSPKGWPDLVLARGLRLLIVELKAEKGRLTPEQETWLEWWRIFGAAVARELRKPRATDPRETPRIEVYVWRPADIDTAYRVLS